jgi:hypothetical protein
METDYYLHNFHVKTGKGTLQSMKGFQRAFGVVSWNDEDPLVDVSNENYSIASSGSLPGSKTVRPQRLQSRSLTASSVETSVSKQEDESRRIARVRNRCNAQNQALSSWWKVAIQANIQQRMWMQLGKSPTESLLPPRFERNYQPEKMAQFDRFFARSWVVPVRRSHSQHSEGSDEENDFVEFRRNISGRLGAYSKPASTEKDIRQEEQGDASLNSFVEDYGFEPRVEPSLKMLIEHHGGMSFKFSGPCRLWRSAFVSSLFHVLTGTADIPGSYPYIGDTGLAKESPPEEYTRYVRPLKESSSNPFQPKTMAEFKESLLASSLCVDDVNGIKEVRYFL